MTLANKVPGADDLVGDLARGQSMRLPPAVAPIAALCFCAAFFSENPVLAMVAALVLPLGAVCLWRSRETPILLFVFAFQWAQISSPIYNAAFLGVHINETVEIRGSDLETVSFVSLLALFLLAVGMRIGAGAVRPIDAAIMRRQAQQHASEKWFWFFIAAWGVGSLSLSFMWLIPGLSQIFLAVSGLRWAAFFILTYVAFSTQKGQKYWLAAFLLELVLSFGGFFSDFKTVFFFSLFGMIAANARLSARTYLGLGVFVSFLLVLAVVWSAIKSDYRQFASGGQNAQVVSVDASAQLGKLNELVSQLDGPRMAAGLEALVARVGYTSFFAAVVTVVPDVVPHENGAIWWDAVTRPFMPRLFFPDKAIIDDSQRTAQYTGVFISGAESATSISIGYMGETYIDFGFYGMFVAMTLLGCFLGYLYRLFVTAASSRGLLGMGLASVVIHSMTFLESSITKSFGGLIVAALSAYCILRFVIPRVAPWTRA